MKKVYTPNAVNLTITKLLFLLFLFVGFTQTANAAFCVAGTNRGALTITSGTFTNIAASGSGTSPYWSFTGTAGYTYSFKDGTATSDTYIRIYDSGTNQIAANDDYGPHNVSSTSASIDWICPSTGTYYVQFTEFSCVNLSANRVFSYKVVPGQAFVYGSNQWYTSYFNGRNWCTGSGSCSGNSYQGGFWGFYTESTLNFNTASTWSGGTNGAPYNQAGFQGGAGPNGTDQFSWSTRRQGFPCGYYTLTMPNHDDDTYWYIDANGDGTWDVTGSSACCTANLTLGSFYLGPNSKIAIETFEYGGGASASLTFSAATALSITSSSASMCSSNGTRALTANVAGGTWSGTGVSGSSFNPSGLGSVGGTAYTVTYSLNGCSTSQNITVYTTPGTPSISISSGNGTSVVEGTAITYTSSAGSPNGSFQYFEYNWNNGGWSGSWGTTNPYVWGASSPGNTLYVRAVYGNGGCNTASAQVSTPVTISNVGWTGQSGVRTNPLSPPQPQVVTYNAQPTVPSTTCPSTTGNWSSNWCAGSGTYTYLNNGLVGNVNYTIQNQGGTSCSGATAMPNAYLEVYWNGGSTTCGWGKIGNPALNSISFTANPSAASGQHIVTVTSGSNYTTATQSCGQGVGWDGTLSSAVLRYRQDTYLTNGTSTAAICSNGTKTCTATLQGGYGTTNGPTISWSLAAGSATGNFGTATQTNGTSTVTFTPTGTGTAKVVATIGTYSCQVDFTVNAVPTVALGTVTGPTTCGGTNGSIQLTGLAASTTYVVNFKKGGVDQTPLSLASNGSGVLTISGLGAGAYTAINVTLNGCTSANLSATVSDPTPPSITSNTPTNPTTCSGTNGQIVLGGLTASTTYSLNYNKNSNPVGAANFTSNASGQITITGLTAGTYNNFIATVNNCSSTAYPSSGSITLSDPATPSISSNTPTNPTTCSPGNNGQIVLNGLTASTTYSVNYKKNGSFVGAANFTSNASGQITITGLTAGTYDNFTVTVNNCTSAAHPSSGTITLSNPATPAISGHTPTNPSTCGGNGTIVLTGLTASTVYSVNYLKNGSAVGAANFTSNASGQITITNTAGVYTNFTVTVNGCTSANYPASGNITLTDPTTPAISSHSASNPSTCTPGTDGQIVLSGLVNGQIYSVNYKKNGSFVGAANFTANASGQITISGLTAGTYDNFTAAITATSCTSAAYPSSGSITLSNPATPSIASHTATNPTTCSGNGTIVLNGLSASTVYSVNYVKNGSAVGAANFTSNASGQITITNTATIYTNFTVTVNGCTSATYPASGNITLTDPATPSISSHTATNPSTCSGTGTIVLSGLTASTVYSVNYNRNGSPVGAANFTANGSGQITITNTAGTYTNFTVTINNCTSAAYPSSGNIVLSDPTTPAITSNTPTNPTTCSGTNGQIVLGGLAASTTYSLNYSKGGTPVGAASFTSNASGQITVSGLTAGVYTNFTVTLSGCTSANYPASGNITLSDPATPGITSNTPTNPTTCSGTNGQIVLGGLAASTTYSLNYSKGGTPVGAANFTSNASGQITITGLTAGVYTNFTVTLSGCTSANYPSSGNITLSDPATPAISSNTPTNPTTCSPGNNGQIVLGGLAASTTYSLNYSKGGTPVGAASFTSNASGQITITGLTAGVYTNFTVTLSGCTSANYPSSGNITLSNPATPAITSNTPTNPTTCSGTNGQIVLGGLANSTTYTLNYNKGGTPVGAASFTSNASGQITVTGLTAGVYTNFTVTISGCTSATYPSSGNITLSDPATPAITSGTPTNPTTCSGTNGQIVLGGLANSTTYTLNYSKGGTPVGAASFTSNASGQITVTGLTAGVYTNFTVTISGCTSAIYPSSGNITLSDPATPAITSNTPTNPSTCLGTSGQIVLGGLANNTTYSINYKKNGTFVGAANFTSNASGQITITGLTAGAYDNFTATANGCTSASYPSSGTITLSDPATPSFTLTSVNPTSCNGTDGSITLSGLTASVTYTLNYARNGTAQPQTTPTTNGSGQLTISGLSSASYTNIIVTRSGCSSPAGSVTLTDPTGPATPTATVTAQPTCAVPTGTITITAPTGANLVYSNDGSVYTNTTGVFSGLVPGSYTLTVKNTTTLCVSGGTTLSVNAVPSSPTVPVATVTTQPTCTTPSGTITVTSPLGAYEYAVDLGAYTSSTVLSGVAPGNHTVTARLTASPTCVSQPSGTLTVNAVPLPPSAIPSVSICQGGNGTIDASGSIDCINNFAVPTYPYNSGNTPTSIRGGWFQSSHVPPSPTANAPVGSNTSTCGAGSFAGAVRTYSTVDFQVSASGLYTFEMNDNSAYNGAGYIVTGGFTPGSCGTGTLVVLDQDGGVNDEPKLGPVALQAGITYTLVSTTEGATDVTGDDYTWTMTTGSGGQIMVQDPGDVQWYNVASGGTPLATGTTYNPVGAPGSGVTGTAAGTWTFYAACSNSPDCRRSVNFTITNTANVYNVTPGTSTCYNASTPVSVGLDNSTNGSGNVYTLWRDGVNTGTTATGTGSAITLGNTTTAGTYTVTVQSGSCNIPMNGSVTVKPLPIADAGADVTLPCASNLTLNATSNSSTLFTENFGTSTNNQVTTTSSGWKVNYLIGAEPGNRTEWWISYNGASPYSFTCATSGSALTMVDNRIYEGPMPCDYAWDEGDMDEIAYNTTEIDARLYTSVNLSFDYLVGGTAVGSNVYDYLQVMYSLDNGTTWVPVSAGNNAGTYSLYRGMGSTNAFFAASPTSGTANISMPSAVAGQKFLLGFRWVNDGDLTGAYVGGPMVDNILVSGSASYSWSPTAGVTGANTSAATITQGGTYTVVVTAGNGCTASDQVVVTAASSPTVSISGNQDVCVGGSTTMTANISGGTGTITNVLWERSANGGGSWSTVQNTASATYPTSTSLGTGNYLYRSTATTSYNCTYTSPDVPADVKADPLITLDPVDVNLCSGGTATLTMAASGGTPSLQYEWEYDDATIVSNGNPSGVSFSGATTTDLTITTLNSVTPASIPLWAKVYAAGPGCDETYTLFANVNILADPTVSNPTPATQTGICNGGSASPISVTANGGIGSYNYQWYSNTSNSNSGGTLISGANGSSYTPTSVGTGTTYYYCVIGQAGSGCGPTTSANTASVTANTAVTANVVVDECMNFAVGDKYYVLVTGSGGTPPYTYPGAFYTSTTNQGLHELNAGSSSTYTVSDASGCSATSGSVTAPTGRPSDLPFTTTTGQITADCWINDFNRWVTFRDQVTNNAIMAINDNHSNLGLVTVDVYKDATPPTIYNSSTAGSCPSTQFTAMRRHFKMSSTQAPTTGVDVMLFFTDDEYATLKADAWNNNTGYPNAEYACTELDDVYNFDQIYVTKYTGANEDGNYLNNLQSGLYRVFGDNTTPNRPLIKGQYTGSNTGFQGIYGGAQTHHYVQMTVTEFSEFWLHGSQQHSTPLPVSMIYLQADAINNAYIRLSWATATEINNRGFEVERSTDGQNWTQVGFVDGHNNSTVQNNYSYDDMNVAAGIVYYYRLKQVDYDNAFEYTDIVSARITGETTFSVKEFIPNPTTDRTSLIVTGTKEQEINIAFYNVVGQKVLESSHVVNRGANTIAFDLARLASGTYTAVVSSANEVYTQKIVLAR